MLIFTSKPIHDVDYFINSMINDYEFFFNYEFHSQQCLGNSNSIIDRCL